MPDLHIRLSRELPRLRADNYRETSPPTWTYNCVAWAAGVVDAWWWPIVGRFWPESIPREETVTAFLQAFALLGYQTGHSVSLDSDIEKVALYAEGKTPTHAARQLPEGWWTSKLGPSVDIEHATPDDVAGGLYGEVVAIVGRKRKQ